MPGHQLTIRFLVDRAPHSHNWNEDAVLCRFCSRKAWDVPIFDKDLAYSHFRKERCTHFRKEDLQEDLHLFMRTIKAVDFAGRWDTPALRSVASAAS